MSVYFIIFIVITIWVIVNGRSESIVGRLVDNLYRYSILMENEEYEAAQYAVKMMGPQFKRLSDKNISLEEFQLIAKRVRPAEKVERAIRFLAILNNKKKEVETKEDSEKFEKWDEGLEIVLDILKEMGYDLTKYGIAVTILGLESDYSPEEMASYITLCTMARDIKELGYEIGKIVVLSCYIPERILPVLKKYKDLGKIRQKQWDRDVNAFVKIGMIDTDQKKWIEMVLNDPVAGKERLATRLFKI